MELDLVHRRHDVGLGHQPLEVVDPEVRDADRAGAAVFLELLERAPGGDVIAVVQRRRPVDQEQVDVVEAELLERPLEGAARVVRAVIAVVQLACDVDVAPVEPDSRIPSPTSLSLPYISAVSMWR